MDGGIRVRSHRVRCGACAPLLGLWRICRFGVSRADDAPTTYRHACGAATAVFVGDTGEPLADADSLRLEIEDTGRQLTAIRTTRRTRPTRPRAGPDPIDG